MERKLAGESQDVPGIDGGPAADGAKQEIDRLVEFGDRRRGIAPPPERLAGCHAQARDPGKHPRRSRRHLRRQLLGRCSPTEPGHDRGERDMLHLGGPTAGERRVDMPANASECLTKCGGLGLEP